jgi:hypothetical protein
MVGVGERNVFALHEDHIMRTGYERGYGVRGKEWSRFMECLAFRKTHGYTRRRSLDSLRHFFSV